MVTAALEAAEELAGNGVQVSVVNVASVKPLDEETIIRMAKATGAVVTAEEHTIIGGLGSAVAEVLAENAPTPMIRVGLKDSFGQSGRPLELLEKYGLTSKDIVKAVDEVLKKK
jgi:transketolase